MRRFTKALDFLTIIAVLAVGLHYVRRGRYGARIWSLFKERREHMYRMPFTFAGGLTLRSELQPVLPPNLPKSTVRGRCCAYLEVI